LYTAVRTFILYYYIDDLYAGKVGGRRNRASGIPGVCVSKIVRTGIWLVVALVALGFLGYRTYDDADTWRSFKGAMTAIDWGWAAAAVALQMVAQTLLATRWLVLLRTQDVRIGLLQAVKLTYFGLFYNNFMPGGVGGDLLKAWYVTRHSREHLRVNAAVTVFVDRLIGLVGTILMAGIASVCISDDTRYMNDIRLLVWGIFAVMMVAGAIFCSRRAREALLIGRLLSRLPFRGLLRKVDASLHTYGKHRRQMVLCLALTGALQGMTIVAVWFLAMSLGLEDVRLVHCLIIMPLVWLIGAAIPVPGGLGIIENAIMYLFSRVINWDDAAGAAGQASALAVLNRVMILYVCSLGGALVPLFGGHLPKASQIEREMKQQTHAEVDDEPE